MNVDLDNLRKSFRQGLKSSVYHQRGIYDDQNLRNNESVPFPEFARLKMPAALAIAQEEVGLMPMQFPDKKPDEDQAVYDRKMLMWQAEREGRRAEARADKRTVLRGAIACLATIVLMAWGVGVLAFFGVEHTGLTVAAIITGVLLMVGAIILLIKHDGMRVPE